MTQLFAGHVIDEDGFELEVWVETQTDGTKEHVFVLYGGSELTDFPFKQPNQNCDLSEAAQLLAEDEATKQLSLPILVFVGAAQ